LIHIKYIIPKWIFEVILIITLNSFLLIHKCTHKIKYFIETLIKWIQYVLSLNQIFIFLLKNSIFQIFFLSIKYKSTYRILVLVLVINYRNEVLTSVLCNKQIIPVKNFLTLFVSNHLRICYVFKRTYSSSKGKISSDHISHHNHISFEL